jgi:DNA-binding beta-propeller fold protein YncE
LAVLAALLGALLMVLGLGAMQILDAGRGSAAALPPLAALSPAIAPRFLFAINGVSRPLGVALSSAGDRIYVTESDGQRETRVFDRDGGPLGVLSPPGTEPAGRTPVYVAVDSGGRVYVSDRRSGGVHLYSPEDRYLGQLEPPEGSDTPWAPLALGFAPEGNLLVSDVLQGRQGIVVLGPEGRLLQRLGGGPGYEELSYPNGVAVDRQGRILVADSNNGRVLALDPGGSLLWTLGRGGGGPSMGMPRGLALDDQERLHVVDSIRE